MLRNMAVGFLPKRSMSLVGVWTAMMKFGVRSLEAAIVQRRNRCAPHQHRRRALIATFSATTTTAVSAGGGCSAHQQLLDAQRSAQLRAAVAATEAAEAKAARQLEAAATERATELRELIASYDAQLGERDAAHSAVRAALEAELA